MILVWDAAALVIGALEALSCPALLIDDSERVVGVTVEAEKMLRAERFIRVRQKRLEAVDRAGNVRLQSALSLACRRHGIAARALPTNVVLRDDGGTIKVAEIVSLPEPKFNLRFGPVAIVAFRRRKPLAAAPELLREAFGFTLAESEIALVLLDGTPTASIAKTRRTSLETVRTQIKGLLYKAGVNSRASLCNLLRTIS